MMGILSCSLDSPPGAARCASFGLHRRQRGNRQNLRLENPLQDLPGTYPSWFHGEVYKRGTSGWLSHIGFFMICQNTYRGGTTCRLEEKVECPPLQCALCSMQYAMTFSLMKPMVMAIWKAIHSKHRLRYHASSLSLRHKIAKQALCLIRKNWGYNIGQIDVLQMGFLLFMMDPIAWRDRERIIWPYMLGIFSH